MLGLEARNFTVGSKFGRVSDIFGIDSLKCKGNEMDIRSWEIHVNSKNIIYFKSISTIKQYKEWCIVLLGKCSLKDYHWYPHFFYALNQWHKYLYNQGLSTWHSRRLLWKWRSRSHLLQERFQSSFSISWKAFSYFGQFVFHLSK